MKVKIYWNRHRDLWSVVVNGKVIDRCQHVELTDVTPKISRAGRSRARREGVRNVHAFLEGTLVRSLQDVPVDPLTGVWSPPEKHGRIRYNPFTDKTFKIDFGRPGGVLGGFEFKGATAVVASVDVITGRPICVAVDSLAANRP